MNNSTSEKPKPHGGARPGAGRRSKNLVRINASLSQKRAEDMDKLREELAWEGDGERHERSRTEIIEMALLLLREIVQTDARFQGRLKGAPQWFDLQGDLRLPFDVDSFVKRGGNV